MDEKTNTNSVDENAQDNYSLDMVDTIFADTLSRGMQNAIVSQQNAQMASSSSVTHACARILQAQSKPEAAIEINSGEKKQPMLEQSIDVQSDLTKKARPRSKLVLPVVGVILLSLFIAGTVWQYIAI
ncbi:RebB family R body protein [Vibrio sp. Of14-4]|uniref:RebB family R body protein n=1 Tax=Vibrio sp. Of14-4 TaxID=2724878 RepID=UPI001EF1A457|nr:RebB family R body protein [Vibrio sp. Of14-4]MCG7488392.1 RebB family R body protein [Vibrio sp. Of14-4]